MVVKHYKCPNCGDDMRFDTESGMLLCKSCGNKENIETFSEELITKTFSEDEAREYSCNNCGAVVLTDADTTATNCSFCGAGVVLSDRLSGVLMPSKVIPFTISKEQAEEAFKQWVKKGRLAPNRFKEANRIKKITGMYVPFWLYDLNNDIEVEARATKVRSYTRGDYIYTETKHYDVYRDINLDFTKVPADASEKMDDEIMDKLEPYNYADLKEFKTPYLVGYLAEKYNYDDKELFPRVKAKMEKHVNAYISSTINGYDSISYRQKRINTTKTASYYTLFPVWMVYYDFEKSEHIFAMNGQTGKIIGKPPISKGKVFGWIAGISSATFVIARIITMLLGGGVL